MIKAIIVDDELNAIKNLKWEIENFGKDIEVCDTFTNPVEAISAINYLKPDCVFLDIEMPEMDGFQLLSQLSFKDFDLIITTAYDNYAIKAFKAHAIDYLLKPIDSDDLLETISRVRKNQKQNSLGEDVKKIIESFKPIEKPKRLALPLVGKTIYVNMEDIIYCKSDGNYTEIHLVNDEKQMLSKKLKEIEEQTSVSFFRVHNSYLVNINFIKEFVKNEGLYLVLQNGSSIPVSRSKKAELLQLLNS
ncbi:LytTR family DNA-binding domain-containing protein [Psychroserpens sp. SPM9]|uniref:LytR/AlgR family response regulator transcription factor n=1 Tax=Psychroserpens sp. SPM9 TaxID=2975598 RepID=UPI0021A556E2|nr:LytTR family DNA-binding domain-containing protein [Psychroserpens sp. SPM9]MDG5491217.1 LytTR family DNA-binding domain-containing protein [Psychroserpens sp. SPM9]